MSVKQQQPAGPRRKRRWGEHDGFTLLEVMIALAILAIALSSLFGSQSQSLSLAIEGKFNTAAALLAREKLAEYSAGVVEPVSGEGDFGDVFPDFSWRAEVRDAGLELLAENQAEQDPLLRLDLVITWQDERYSASFTEYILRGERK